MAIANHLIYLLISLAFTVWVGRSLYTNGHPFLLECLGSDKLADSVNRLFLAGFYLMNMGLVFVALKYGETGLAVEDSLEVLAGRIGFVALVMGLMHFNNLFWCDFVRSRRAKLGG
ncbi:MAG: hypothetical protein AB8B55_23320 [Mariniblastus sp.]